MIDIVMFQKLRLGLKYNCFRSLSYYWCGDSGEILVKVTATKPYLPRINSRSGIPSVQVGMVFMTSLRS